MGQVIPSRILVSNGIRTKIISKSKEEHMPSATMRSRKSSLSWSLVFKNVRHTPDWAYSCLCLGCSSPRYQCYSLLLTSFRHLLISSLEVSPATLFKRINASTLKLPISILCFIFLICSCQHQIHTHIT